MDCCVVLFNYFGEKKKKNQSPGLVLVSGLVAIKSLKFIEKLRGTEGGEGVDMYEQLLW